MAQQNDIIKDQDFLNWTNAWSESEFSTSGFTNLFAEEQSGVEFSNPSMLDIVSTVGLDIIQMRFGLVPNQGPDDINKSSFQVFMYGIDGLGTRITPYYGSTPIPPLLNDDMTQHEVPDVIAQEWRALWKKKLEDDSVDASCFTTNYGYLRGYSYDMRTVVDTLFPGPDIRASKINVLFGLHQYLGREANPDKPTFTFGLILHSQIAKAENNQKSVNDPDDENVYYDLSAPCPPTCH